MRRSAAITRCRPRPAPAPDLTGLSCRWGVAPARHGVVLSVIVSPRGDDPRYQALVGEVVGMALDASQSEPPITVESLQIKRAAAGHRARGRGPQGFGRLGRQGAHSRPRPIICLALPFITFKLKAGGFDAAVYAGDVAANADFRKFDDGLRMTLDCSRGLRRLAGSPPRRGRRLRRLGRLPAEGCAAHLFRALDHRKGACPFRRRRMTAATRWRRRR